VDETVPGSHVDEMVLQSAKELMTSNNERPEADDKQRAELCVSDVISLPKQLVFKIVYFLLQFYFTEVFFLWMA
jgi:hypothetical protein